MKNTLLLLCFLCALNLSSQNIETTVITLDLSSPHPESVKNSNGKDKLVVKSKNPLAFKLINGNPFRYDYSLNYRKVKLFNDKQFTFNLESLKDSASIVAMIDSVGNQIDEDKIKNDLSTIKERIISLNEKIEEFINAQKSKDKLDFENFVTKREKFKIDFIKILKDYASQAKKIEQIDVSDEIKKLAKDIDKLLEEGRLKIQKLLSVNSNPYLLPIDVNGDNIDYVEVRLDVLEKGESLPQTYLYKIWITGGFKLDVSGGGYITSLFNSEYRTVLDPTTNKSIIYSEDKGEYDFGFGAMLNVTLRNGSWVKPSLSIGTLLTSNQKFQILTGLGFIIGKNERVIIHGGLSMGRVDVLDSNYKADGTTQYDLGAEGNVPLVDKFQFGHFFGITYNFSKPKKKSETSED